LLRVLFRSAIVLSLGFLSSVNREIGNPLFCQETTPSTTRISAAIQQKLDAYNAQLEKSRELPPSTSPGK
jgi:hypothetical protein